MAGNRRFPLLFPANVPPGLLAAMMVAILVRLAVLIITAQIPIVADGGTLISPSIASGTDLGFYQNWKNEMFSWADAGHIGPRPEILDRRMIAGPVFPALLYLFKYENGNSWPLAIFFFASSACLSLAWLHWLHQQGLSSVSLMIFALLPHPIYYMICVGTELPFSVLFAAFFFSYFKKAQDQKSVYLWIFLLLLLLLTRPNALAVLVFVIIDQIVQHRGHLRSKGNPVFFGLLLLAGIVFGAFFYSYFMMVFSATSATLFFGIPADRYVQGLFPALPNWLDQACSLVTLIGAKLLYFFGLRPSYSDVSMIYVLARALPGFLFLIGLAYLFVKGDQRHKQLVFIFMLPILVVVSQDRYSVPIQPLLFLYFAKAFDHLILPWAKRKASPCSSK